MEKRYKPISAYGLIGNCRSAALVALDGSIDWCCFPRFDAPSVFAAILDADKGGHFALTPKAPYTSTQRYVGDSNVLQTQFVTGGGMCNITDCMPLYLADEGALVERDEIIRIVRCEEGAMTLYVDYAPRPDYGRATPVLRADGNRVTLLPEDPELVLYSPVSLPITGNRAVGEITLQAGDEVAFVLCYGNSQEGNDTLLAIRRVHRTVAFWEGIAGEVLYEGRWREHVVRSYLTLHLLTYLPTGAIIASPTTSLPEEIGGVRNWDYRYTWLRDAAFTVEALLSLGHQNEARDFFRWLRGICTECASRNSLQIMFRIDGDPDLPELELVHLEGYRGSRPVRIGNAASEQDQHDMFGEVLASAHLLAAAGEPVTDGQWELLRMLANMASVRCQEPDRGIWEVRGGPYHFVYSKVMCWVALRRAVALAEQTGRTGAESDRWNRVANTIRQDILDRGWHKEKQAFIQHYGTNALDASNLLLPLVGFLAADDPMLVSTVRAITHELGYGPFLRRYRPEETDDGLTGGEGAFMLCSFWLVRVLARMGRTEEAERLLGEILSYANHLGLFSEMVDTRTGELLGNFPQAFTHIGLILAVLECDSLAARDDG